MNKLGNRIYELRTKQGITQESLAERVGVTRQAISKWERGEGSPDLANISSLADVLGVTIDQLLEKESPQEELLSSLNTKGPSYLKALVLKAKTTSNSEEAKKIRNGLILAGGIGLAIGIIMLLSGFIGFAKGGLDAVNSFGAEPFNPIPKMMLFMGGGIVIGLSTTVLYAGLSIVVVGVASNYLDNRKKCPTCGDGIDEGEKMCSNCGTDLSTIDLCPSCGNKNKPEDNFCRECGFELKKGTV